MKSIRLVGGSLLLAVLAACSSTPDTAVLTAPAFAKGSSGGGGTPTPAPNLAGHWAEVQNPPFQLPDGTYQVTFYEFDATQSGSTLSGTVNRYVSYYDANMQPLVLRRDLGTPGKLTGSISGTTVTLGFIRVGESKLTSGYTTTLSADLRTLTVQNPTEFGPKAFVR